MTENDGKLLNFYFNKKIFKKKFNKKNLTKIYDSKGKFNYKEFFNIFKFLPKSVRRKLERIFRSFKRNYRNVYNKFKTLPK